MHYKNGREAKPGDQVVSPSWDGKTFHSGYLVAPNAQSQSCNARLVPTQLVDQAMLVTIGQCLHVEDAITGFVEAAKEPEPAPVPLPSYEA